ncbi:hypothetical protein I545_6681 [Mycobacterium kansasii 662]|uniref:Uncharacterized protein n=1 Tax=Mycobacterium kansasii 662 TaxID=1299326 RepID=X7Y3C5_MYCKA|nr:hypothetical protein I545_6681 [Mycobacterium kansasii 662]
MSGDAVKFVDEVLAGDAAVYLVAETFAGCSSMIETILNGRPSVVESN